MRNLIKYLTEFLMFTPDSSSFDDQFFDEFVQDVLSSNSTKDAQILSVTNENADLKQQLATAIASDAADKATAQKAQADADAATAKAATVQKQLDSEKTSLEQKLNDAKAKLFPSNTSPATTPSTPAVTPVVTPDPNAPSTPTIPPVVTPGSGTAATPSVPATTTPVVTTTDANPATPAVVIPPSVPPAGV